MNKRWIQKRVLGAFAKSRKATVSFCLSVRPHGTNRLALGEILITFYIGGFFETLSRELKFYSNVTWISGTLHEDLCALMMISRGILLRTRNVSYESCREHHNTRFMFGKLFHQNRAVYEIMWGKYKGADKSLAQPGRKQATATEDFDFHISYL